MKRKFKVDVYSVDSYEIEIDEMYIDNDFFEGYNKEFHEVSRMKDHVKNVAIHRSLYGDSYIPGYGRPLVNGLETSRTPFGDGQRGINIKVISERDEDNVKVNVEEVDSGAED